MVPAIPGLGGGVLPYRRTILAVVRDLHLEHSVSWNQTAYGDGAERDLASASIGFASVMLAAVTAFVKVNVLVTVALPSVTVTVMV